MRLHRRARHLHGGRHADRYGLDYDTGPSYQVQTTLLTCSSACPVVKSSTAVSLTQPKSPVRPGDAVSFNGAASVKAPGSASWSRWSRAACPCSTSATPRSPWTTVKTLTTDASGRYSGSYAPSVSGYYRVARAANATQAGSVSPSRYVAVAKAATAVSLTTFTPTTVRAGAALTLGGQASIRNPGASTWAPMVGGGLSVQFRPTTTSSWATVKTTSTNASGAYLTSYVPTKSGYYRVYRAANAKQAESASAASSRGDGRNDYQPGRNRRSQAPQTCASGALALVTDADTVGTRREPGPSTGSDE